ncbi:MAG: hypothetical protein KDM64_07520 [Verrucomicrobiae bacterium]|nr:hypothetical protein [Verrucomicrobiae bacterium]
MKRQPYFPRQVAERPEWFRVFAEQLDHHNPVLGLPAVDLAEAIADAVWLEYLTRYWVPATRDFGPASTATLALAYRGTGDDPMVLPGFEPPALPTGVTARRPGALYRIFDFVQTIKKCPNYSESIGLQMGIVGEEDTSEAETPTFEVDVETGAGSCDCAKIRFQKNGYKGVVVFSRRGGGDWEMLGIDLASPYLDERPLLVPTTPEIREYRLQGFEDDGPTGEMTPPVSVTIGPK